MTNKACHPFRRRVRAAREAMPEVDISEREGIRSLHLGSDTVQSSMSLDDPTELVLSYSRVMMGFLLFYPDPKHILQIGLGGGSLARFIYHYLPNTTSTVVEINAQVIAVARSLFALPKEDKRFNVVEANGADYVKIFRHSTDVILVDGFDGLQIAEELTTEDFFADCYRALGAQGVFVTNWWSGDKRYFAFVERLLRVFEGRVLELPAASHGNVSVMAFRHTPPVIAIKALKQGAASLECRFGLEFVDFVERLAMTNTLYHGKLVL